MPILYKPTKWAFVNEGPELTEQEHKDSCDINKMIAAARRGHMLRAGPSPVYGFDDTTLDPVTYRIQKQQIEMELADISQKHEFSEDEIQKIPDPVKKKFGFKTKKAKNVPKNDDQTTITEPTPPSDSKTKP